MSETPDIVYGRLLESAHISGYSFERLCEGLLSLLSGDDWKKVGPGYQDVNEFLRSIDMSAFNLDDKPKLHKRIKQLQPKASTRAIGKATGTSHMEVHRDLKEDAAVSDVTPGTQGVPTEQDKQEEPVTSDTGTNQEPVAPTGREAAQAAKKAAEKQKKAAEREQREKQRAAERAQQPEPTMPDGIRIETCRAAELLDAAGIEPGTVDLIFTDPPYPVEFVECWTELGDLAVKALKPGGLLVAYTGQYTMPEALHRLRAAGLDYFWTYAIAHTGAFFQMYVTHVQCGWKPLLVFRNGHGDPPDWHKDFVADGGREKSDHEWQQSEAEAAYWIGELSKPGQLVMDPFVGGGTTPVVCRNLGRQFVGCDIDPAAVHNTRERLA